MVVVVWLATMCTEYGPTINDGPFGHLKIIYTRASEFCGATNSVRFV
jgi:hypothetical protein